MGGIWLTGKTRRRLLVASTLLLFLFQSFDSTLRATVKPVGECSDLQVVYCALVTTSIDLNTENVEHHRQTGMDCHDCPMCLVKAKLFIRIEPGIDYLTVRFLPISSDSPGILYFTPDPPLFPDFHSRAPPA